VEEETPQAPALPLVPGTPRPLVLGPRACLRSTSTGALRAPSACSLALRSCGPTRQRCGPGIGLQRLVAAEAASPLTHC